MMSISKQGQLYGEELIQGQVLKQSRKPGSFLKTKQLEGFQELKFNSTQILTWILSKQLSEKRTSLVSGLI
jgi:hypothetical protein